MRNLLRPFAASVLGVLARLVVCRYHPRIVMVTGSVGKTSTKDAVAAVLSAKFQVRKSEKSFNSEFGVPFTIFGVGSPWGKPLAWLSVFKSAAALLVLPNHYPNMLVLEVGADRPGDLARILRTAQPEAVVVTRLPEVPVHVEAYSSPEAVREEEFSPALALAPDASLILSADDAYALELAKGSNARVLSFGEAEGASVRLSGVEFYEEEGAVRGMRCLVTAEGEESAVVVKGSVGRTQVYPAGAAIALGLAYGLTLQEAVQALNSYEPPPGRGRLVAGREGSVLVDDSYNASPSAVEEALSTLRVFPGAKRRIAVLGDMLELGRHSVEEHRRIGALAAKSADMVVSVGVRARGIVEAAREAGKGEDAALSYDTSREAGAALREIIREGDVVLVKGSQSIRMERVLEMLLSSEADRPRLVRQEREWIRKP